MLLDFHGIFAQEFQMVGNYSIEEASISYAVSGNQGYLCSPSVLYILDIQNPENPIGEGFCPGFAAIEDVKISETYAFLSHGLGLNVVDVSDSGNPVTVGGFMTGYRMHGSDISGAYIFCVDFYGMKILDISDPSNPAYISEVQMPPEAHSVVIRDSLAYISDFVPGLYIVNISDPTSPVLLGNCPIPGGAAMKCCLKGDFAFIAGNAGGLAIINISDPTQPYQVANFDLPGYAWAISIDTTGVDSNYLYLAGYSLGVRVFDISDNSNPVYVAGYDTTRDGLDIDAANGLIYWTVGDGLSILRFVPNEIDENYDVLPEAVSLRAYPNPFNAETRIHYFLTRTGQTSLTIYNIQGQKVATIFQGYQAKGDHAITWDARALSSGVYIARLDGVTGSQTTKLVLLK